MFFKGKQGKFTETLSKESNRAKYQIGLGSLGSLDLFPYPKKEPSVEEKLRQNTLLNIQNTNLTNLQRNNIISNQPNSRNSSSIRRRNNLSQNSQMSSDKNESNLGQKTRSSVKPNKTNPDNKADDKDTNISDETLGYIENLDYRLSNFLFKTKLKECINKKSHMWKFISTIDEFMFKWFVIVITLFMLFFSIALIGLKTPEKNSYICPHNKECVYGDRVLNEVYSHWLVYILS